MSLGKCRECGRAVSTSAGTCPGCGVKSPIKSPRTQLGCGSLLVGAVVVLVGVKVCGGKGTPDDPAAEALRDRSTQCEGLVYEQMQLRRDVRSGGAHVTDATVRLRMIEADAKRAGCQTLDRDKLEYIADKHAAKQATPSAAPSTRKKP